MAKSLAESVFKDIDFNKDGKISCQEFLLWHQQQQQSSNDTIVETSWLKDRIKEVRHEEQED